MNIIIGSKTCSAKCVYKEDFLRLISETRVEFPKPLLVFPRYIMHRSHNIT